MLPYRAVLGMVRRVHAEGLRERQNMRNASKEPETPPFELAALSNGEELYRTEYQDSREEAEQAAREANEMLANGKVFEHNGETVDEFIAVETDE